MPRSDKLLKEDFVSNLPGGSISEINYVTAVAPVGNRRHFPVSSLNRKGGRKEVVVLQSR